MNKSHYIVVGAVVLAAIVAISLIAGSSFWNMLFAPLLAPSRQDPNAPALVGTGAVAPADASGTASAGQNNTNNNSKNTMSDQTAQAGDTVFVNYTGTLENGTKFDSSYDRGQPIQFILGVGRVIKGWDTGIVGMKVGDKKHLVISPANAYGAAGVPDGKGGYIIPPNATLIFDVELMSIQRPQ